jgi:hypothetical protein
MLTLPICQNVLSKIVIWNVVKKNNLIENRMSKSACLKQNGKKLGQVTKNISNSVVNKDPARPLLSD